MKLNFIGNFQGGPGGEPADETHIAREIESLGHTVVRIPRDEWREYVIEGCPENKYNVPSDLKADLNIICKWHHFSDEMYINLLRSLSNAPVFYWLWDYMDIFIDWHMRMAKAADLYISGELGLASEYRKNGVKFYYLQFDACDSEAGTKYQFKNKKYDVVYLGSHDNQAGRIDLLKEINKEIFVIVFAHDYEEWKKDGFKSNPSVYGDSFNMVVAQSKIVLGTSGGPHCYGYWSNRIGKVLTAGGFLLQQYAPGMEVFLSDLVEYFSSPQEAIEKIKYFLQHPKKVESVGERFTSKERVKQLLIMAERYLKEDKGKEWLLP